jgi:hypothetical protein
MKIEQYGFRFSNDCGVCGNQHDMRSFDHDLDKFVCDECASDLAFRAQDIIVDEEDTLYRLQVAVQVLRTYADQELTQIK